MSGECIKNKKKFGTMQVADVQPGLCDPVYGCPPPIEVVCIVTEKVYDECKHSEVNEDEFIVYTKVDNPVVETQCKEVKVLNGPTCEVVQPGRVRVAFSYRIKTKIFFEDETSKTESQVINVIKNFNIPRAGEDGLHVQCYVPFIECLNCFVSSEEQIDGRIKTTIICCVGKYMLLKLKATVQLLIPAYGFCPEPPDCDEVLGECPDFQPEWPPFPPQDR